MRFKRCNLPPTSSTQPLEWAGPKPETNFEALRKFARAY
jgi:hypothetical protein